MKTWLLVGCAATNVYLLAAMVIFAAVVYPQFGSVDRSAFGPLYSGFTGRIGLPVVSFEFLAFFATLALYAARPDSTPLWAVHVLTVLGLGYFAITFGWHLPAHRPLAAGDNSDLGALMASQWSRTPLQLVRAGFLLWLCAR
jgi:hypothetical protein